MKLEKVLFLSIGVLYSISVENSVHAYVDPGTTNVIFSSLSYILAGAGVVISFLIIPIKRVYGYFKRKIKKYDN